MSEQNFKTKFQTKNVDLVVLGKWGNPKVSMSHLFGTSSIVIQLKSIWNLTVQRHTVDVICNSSTTKQPCLMGFCKFSSFHICIMQTQNEQNANVWYVHILPHHKNKLDVWMSSVEVKLFILMWCKWFFFLNCKTKTSLWPYFSCT